MKSISILGTIAICATLPCVALAADMPPAAPPPPPPPPVVDPISAAITSILTPLGTAANVVVQPVLVAPVNAVTAVIAPAPPPPAPAPAPVHHHRHHKHHLPPAS